MGSSLHFPGEGFEIYYYATTHKFSLSFQPAFSTVCYKAIHLAASIYILLLRDNA